MEINTTTIMILFQSRDVCAAILRDKSIKISQK